MPLFSLIAAYMTLAILLVGFLSPWPWLGLLLLAAGRSELAMPQAMKTPSPTWQGPHRRIHARLDRFVRVS